MEPGLVCGERGSVFGWDRPPRGGGRWGMRPGAGPRSKEPVERVAVQAAALGLHLLGPPGGLQKKTRAVSPPTPSLPAPVCACHQMLI